MQGNVKQRNKEQGDMRVLARISVVRCRGRKAKEAGGSMESEGEMSCPQWHNLTHDLSTTCPLQERIFHRCETWGPLGLLYLDQRRVSLSVLSSIL